MKNGCAANLFYCGWNLYTRNAAKLVNQSKILAVFILAINADIVFPLEDLSSYSLVVLPMYYAVSKEAGEWLKEYVKNGGTVVATYLTAYVNENTLAYLGGFRAQVLERSLVCMLKSLTHYIQRIQIQF